MRSALVTLSLAIATTTHAAEPRSHRVAVALSPDLGAATDREREAALAAIDLVAREFEGTPAARIYVAVDGDRGPTPMGRSAMQGWARLLASPRPGRRALPVRCLQTRGKSGLPAWPPRIWIVIASAPPATVWSHWGPCR